MPKKKKKTMAVHEMMILVTPGQHSCNIRTSIPETPGQMTSPYGFVRMYEIHSKEVPK